jgi:hypothetical protein
MEPEPVAEDAPAPASERPVRAAAQKAAQKREEEAEAAAKKKAASGKATAAALQKKLAAQKEAASAVEAAQKERIEELEAELLRQQVRAAEAGGVVDEGDRRLGPEGQNDGSVEVHRDGRRHLRRPGVRGHVWMLPALRSFASVAESVGAFGAAA